MYTKEQIQKSGHATTFHKGYCGLCHKEISVTHMRVYNYLNKKQ